MKNLLHPISSILTVLFLVTKVIAEGWPGHYICYYFGDVANLCDGKPVNVCSLPPECSSIAYDGLIIDKLTPDSNGNIVPISFSCFPYLDAIISTDKPSYVLVYHNPCQQMKYDQEPIDDIAKQDSQYISSFLKVHPKLHGLIFSDIDLTQYQNDFPKFTKNFQKYLHYLRKTTSCFTIGVSISAGTLIDLLINKENTAFVDPDPLLNCNMAPENNGWAAYNVSHKKDLDFSVFDMEVDFYVFTFSIFNKCTPEMVHGGTIPLDGNHPHTLQKLKAAIDLLNIKDKKKIYLKFQLYAISNRARWLTYKSECYSTFDKICKHPNETSNWCADNSTTLKQKGKFAADIGGGFVVDSIDLNDPCGACRCKTKFPSFYYLIDGFTGKNTEPECPLFDRQNIKTKK